MDQVQTELTPLHISVDGSLANPHMLIAVILWALVLLVLAAFIFISLFGRARRSRPALALVLLATLATFTPRVQLGFAWLVQTAAARRMIATTFFNPPPGWLAPAIGIPLGIVAGFVMIFRKRRSASASRRRAT